MKQYDNEEVQSLINNFGNKSLSESQIKLLSKYAKMITTEELVDLWSTLTKSGHLENIRKLHEEIGEYIVNVVNKTKFFKKNNINKSNKHEKITNEKHSNEEVQSLIDSFGNKSLSVRQIKIIADYGKSLSDKEVIDLWSTLTKSGHLENIRKLHREIGNYLVDIVNNLNKAKKSNNMKTSNKKLSTFEKLKKILRLKENNNSKRSFEEYLSDAMQSQEDKKPENNDPEKDPEKAFKMFLQRMNATSTLNKDIQDIEQN